MKKLKTLLFASTLLVGFSSVAMAQSSDNATINANATVVQGMVVGDDTNNIEFNNLLQFTSKEINAADGAVDAKDGITGGEERGWFDISIVAGTNVDLTLEVPSLLRNPDRAIDRFNQLFFSVGTSGSDDNDLNGMLTETKPTGTTEVTAITNGAGTDFTFNDGTWTLDSAFEMPAGGTVYLALGGRVELILQPVGSYTGTITLTATVNDD